MSSCLVTGAGRGIGRAVAVALSTAGHSVALTARNAAELAGTAALCPGPTLAIPADITSADGIEGVFAQVEKEFGPVEILVANAGGASSSPLAKITDEDWQAMLDLNLTAPFRCVRRAVPAMVDGGYGRIVVIASVASKVGEPYIAAYTAAKHGVLGLVRSAAAELARTGVTVNAVCPGYVDTPMTDQSVAAIVAKTGRSAAEAREILARKQPTGKLITVEEVSAAVLYCVSNGAVTGQALNVDGGALQS
ncbi:3-hydroxyacyl-CoA dehydrogenase [Longispora fulva]|uniref:NAD(P)-dependent dehydrogenase (Short-subunit alcohol dehydrogenase family) n=1 Tax=Longispora fulva TaxID=619741 RepID=A0A8J7KLL8_9ACTN|nr:SDR family oxidoreductase [Longispora fulva]MBG6139519.1 NAD(P)-dependent dehydrogenase (short-subunit alcohol dehydrogenase family) [Longispora fulva]GIG58098.1 3-hydroxyacyl-CoA dehydrogenase [Longispora fulva]